MEGWCLGVDRGGRRAPQSLNLLGALLAVLTPPAPHVVTECRGLQQRERVNQRRLVQSPQHRRDRPVVAHEIGGAHQELGHVRGTLGCGRRAVRLLEADNGRVLGAHHDVTGVQRAVRDPRLVEPTDLVPEVVEDAVGDRRGIGLGHPRAPDRTDDQQRGARTGDPRDDDRRYVDVSPLGEECHVGLVLDLTQPGEVHLGSGVLVQHRSPDLGDELGIGFIATEHPDQQRPVTRLRHHDRAVARLGRGERHRAVEAGELVQRGTDLRGGRPPAGRAEDQVHDRGNAPPEDDGGERRVRQAGAQVERGQRENQDQQLAEPANRSRQVRRRNCDHRDDHREPNDRERWCLIEPARVVEALHDAGVPDNDNTDEPREEPGGESRNRHVAGEPPAPRDERGDDDQSDRPQRSEPVEQLEERRQGIGQPVDELEEVVLARVLVALVRDHERHQQQRDNHANPVAGAASVRKLGRRPEHPAPPLGHPARLLHVRAPYRRLTSRSFLLDRRFTDRGSR